MLRSFKDGRSRRPGFLEDHAFVAAGLLDLYEATFDPPLAARRRVALAEETERPFADRGAAAGS